MLKCITLGRLPLVDRERIILSSAGIFNLFKTGCDCGLTSTEKLVRNSKKLIYLKNLIQILTVCTKRERRSNKYFSHCADATQ